MNARQTGAGLLAVGSALVAFIATWEGRVNTTRVDPISGVYDVCYGHTGKYAIPGKSYTDAQCLSILKEDIAEHRAGIMACLQAPVNENELDAFTSLAFNLGVQATCDSVPMMLINDGKHDAACQAFMSYSGAWRRDEHGVKIPGSYRIVKGLQNRREAERIWCMTPSTGPRGSSLLKYLQEQP